MRRTRSSLGRAGRALRAAVPFPAVLSTAALLALPLGIGSTSAAEQPDMLPVMTVLVDNARVIRLPERTQTVIVGNPFIAEVTPQKNGVLVLTGKSFGSTNLIALDGAGAMVAETTVRVEAARDTTVTVQRGLDRESLSCTPSCQPSAQLGDAADFYERTSKQADRRRQLAVGDGAAAAMPGGAR